MAEQQAAAGTTREVIWARPARSAKGPAPTLTRDQIAAAAVAVADAEGVDAVSMRRIATALGVGTASLYTYVDRRDELLDLMADFVEGEDGDPPPVSGAWQTDVRSVALRTRALFVRHPWLTTVAAARPSFGPNSLTWTEHGLHALDPLELGDDARLAAAEVINSFVRGFVARELAARQALLASDLDADAWSRSIAPYMDGVVASGRYPRFAAIVRDAGLPHEESRERLFETALDVVLAGLERLHERLALPGTRVIGATVNGDDHLEG